MFQASEVYVDAIKAVVDNTNFEPLKLNAGTHDFAFDYLLPENVPSSYIGKYGNVTYTMKVSVTTNKSEDNAISSEPFLVLRRMPLPQWVDQPLTMAIEKRLWASCTFGKLIVSVSLDRKGGVPGEDVFLTAEIKNYTRRTVTAMQGSLLMQSVFRAQNRHTEFRQIVSKKRDEFEIPHNEGRRWNYVRVTLPPYIPESKLEHCDIIELEYIFQFRVELTGGVEIRMEEPFIIGAQPQGLEIPNTELEGVKINRQWTVRAKGMLGVDEPVADYDDSWDVEAVPEMRNEKVTVNPLFRQNSFLTKGVKVMPEEFVENTRL